MTSLPRLGGAPHTSTDPDESELNPSSTLTREVLPLPLGPRTATNSPGATLRSRFCHRGRAPYLRLAPRRRTVGSADDGDSPTIYPPSAVVISLIWRSCQAWKFLSVGGSVSVTPTTGTPLDCASCLTASVAGLVTCPL